MNSLFNSVKGLKLQIVIKIKTEKCGFGIDFNEFNYYLGHNLCYVLLSAGALECTDCTSAEG